MRQPTLLVRGRGVLQSSSGKLTPCLVVLFALLLGSAMGMRRQVMKFGGTLVVFVV